MDVEVVHAKNPLAGWDIHVTAVAADGETITFARIDVNGFPEWNQTISPPLKKWQKTLSQQGVYPGGNKVLVTVVNDKGDQTRDEDDWG